MRGKKQIKSQKDRRKKCAKRQNDLLPTFGSDENPDVAETEETLEQRKQQRKTTPTSAHRSTSN